MSMLKKAVNKQAFAKVGIYGGAGTGKTRTAAEVALGLAQLSGNKPVAMFDTEPAASYIIPLFEKAGIEFMVYDESRAFKDLMAFTQEAAESCSVVIIDSITHVWRDLQESYLDRVNDTRRQYNKKPFGSLEFQHWGPIKRTWGEFTDLFLSSRVHMIVCGRAGSVYEYQEKDDGSGKKELITVGTKMATEKELGYEPSLLIEMLINRDDGKIINTAFIQKDRADILNGQEIPFPNFEKLSGHFKALNIGGEHFGSMNRRNSKDVFTETGEDNAAAEMRRRDVALDEIKEEILKVCGQGQTAEAKAARQDLLEKVSGTRSWEKLASMRVEEVQRARNALWVSSRGHEYGKQPVELALVEEPKVVNG